MGAQSFPVLADNIPFAFPPHLYHAMSLTTVELNLETDHSLTIISFHE